MSGDGPTSDKWYWSKRGSDERNGPVSGAKLKELAEEGDLEPEDLVWTQGMEDWQEASSAEGVKDFFASPPSLPADPDDEKSTSGDESPSELEDKIGGKDRNTDKTKRQTNGTKTKKELKESNSNRCYITPEKSLEWDIYEEPSAVSFAYIAIYARFSCSSSFNEEHKEEVKTRIKYYVKNYPKNVDRVKSEEIFERARQRVLTVGSASDETSSEEVVANVKGASREIKKLIDDRNKKEVKKRFKQDIESLICGESAWQLLIPVENEVGILFESIDESWRVKRKDTDQEFASVQKEWIRRQSGESESTESAAQTGTDENDTYSDARADTDENATEPADTSKKNSDAKASLWRRHPTWTGVIVLFLISLWFFSLGDGGSGSDVYAVDSINSTTAYMSHQLTSDPRDLSGRMLSGWEQVFSREVGEDIYNAAEDLNNNYPEVDNIRVLLTVDKCRNTATGNVSANVPSGSFVVDDFKEVLNSNSAESFIQSRTWKVEMGLAFARTGGFDECSGSFN
jgi:hypothetical protein